MTWLGLKGTKKTLHGMCDSTLLSKFVCCKKSRTIRQRQHVAESGGSTWDSGGWPKKGEEEQVFRVGFTGY